MEIQKLTAVSLGKKKKEKEKNVSLDATEKIAQLIIDKVQKQNQI